MKLYLFIIAICSILIALFNIFFGIHVMDYSVPYIIMAVAVSVISVIALDALFAALANSLKKKHIKPFSRFFNVTKKQKNAIRKTGLRRIKNYLPDLGKIVNFSKGKIDKPKDKQYIYQYLIESCAGELGHILGAMFGFLIIFIFPLRYFLCFGIPVACVNFILSIMPALVLRYNRYTLVSVYHRLKDSESTSL